MSIPALVTLGLGDFSRVPWIVTGGLGDYDARVLPAPIEVAPGRELFGRKRNFNFYPKAVAEEEWFAFNYADLLGPGERLTGAPTISVDVIAGADGQAASMISSEDTVLEHSRVLQKFVGGVPLVRYMLNCLATTSEGESILLQGKLWVR